MPSMFKSIYKQKINTHEKHPEIDSKKISQTFKLLQQQKNYNFRVYPHKLKDKVGFFSSPEFQYIMGERSEEMAISTCGVAIMACSNFAPCLRISPAFNTLHGDISQLANCDRANSKGKTVKINRLYSRLTDKMSDIMDEKFIDFVNKDPFSVKIISDIPLEWIKIDDLPLMIKYNTSRINTTPGNLFFHKVSEFRGFLVTPEDLTEILVIRSFTKKDPLRNLLELSINNFIKKVDLTKTVMDAYKYNPQKRNEFIHASRENEKLDELDVNVRFVDVSSEKEIIEALDEYTGYIMIFDGHGTHDKDSQIGSILLKDKKFDVWNLKNKTRIPPIVILSACDTHPVDASHASTANGFLAAVALTVLATVLPVNAIYTSIFIGRLILRIKSYIPITINELNTQLRWNNVISGLQRMNYMTETLHLLEENTSLSFDKDRSFRITSEINMLINSNNPYWYERLIDLISKECNIKVDEVKFNIYKYAQFPESMKYVQLGNPEQILITKKEMLDKVKNKLNIGFQKDNLE